MLSESLTLPKEKRQPTRLFLGKLALTGAAIFSCGIWFQSNYRFGLDTQAEPCLDHRFFIYDLKDRRVVRGGLYVFDKRVQSAKTGKIQIKRFLKRAYGVPGDNVVITKDGKLLLNGKELRSSMPLLRFTKQTPADFAKDFTIPDGAYFFLGEIDDSYDSRYWGLVYQDEIRGKGRAIF